MTCEDTRDAIFQVGHRAFVGGNDDFHWTEIGRLQFAFLREHGLLPHHVLYDVACGSLRGGVHFIDYLAPGNYVGFDKYIELIILGVGHELGLDRYASKAPSFFVESGFDFKVAPKPADFAISQSLFTHLTADDIERCLAGIRPMAKPGFRYFTTFFEADESGQANPPASDSHKLFYYSRAEMERFGAQAGFATRYHGAWNHPRSQMMFEYALA